MKNNQTFLSTKKNQKNWELTSSLASDKSKKKNRYQKMMIETALQALSQIMK